MAANLERLSREAGEIADEYKENKALAGIISANSQNLSAAANLIRAYEAGKSTQIEPGAESVLILPPDIKEATEAPDSKKARILAIEDPLKRYKEILSIVRPPSDEELAVLRELEYVDFTIRRTDSLGILVDQDRNKEYFADGQIEHLNTIASIRDFSPPTNFLVGIHLDPNHIFISDSRNQSQAVQAEMIDDFSQNQIKPALPDALAIMLSTTAYTQRDRAFFMKKETRGQKLFKDFRVRGVEILASGDSFAAGRNNAGEKFLVHRYESRGYSSIVAVPAVVFI